MEPRVSSLAFPPATESSRAGIVHNIVTNDRHRDPWFKKIQGAGRRIMAACAGHVTLGRLGLAGLIFVIAPAAPRASAYEPAIRSVTR